MPAACQLRRVGFPGTLPAAWPGTVSSSLSPHTLLALTPVPPHLPLQGIDINNLARPMQAAVVSAITFSLGAGIPLLAAAFVTDSEVRREGRLGG
jgi:hypothetical protein